MTLQKALKDYRLQHGLSKLALGQKLGVSHNQVYRWESGKHRPNRITIEFLKMKGILNENSFNDSK